MAATTSADRELLRAVDALHRALDAVHDRLARELELPRSDLAALVALEAASGPVPMTDLGRRLGLGRPATSALVDRLAARGHVARLDDPADRRRVLVGLTPEAVALGRDVDRRLARTLRDAVAGFSDEELRSARRVVDALVDRLVVHT